MLWRRTTDELPPIDLIVWTKVNDKNGERNVQQLKRYQRSPEYGSVWFMPDGGMYVDYTPTHWAYAD